MKIYEKYDGFIFDLDGTIYVEDMLIDGAKKTINFLIEKRKPIVFVSNKTTGTADEYYAFLKNEGVNISREMIITATETVKNYLLENFANEPLFALGEKAFVNELTESGLRYSENPKEIKIVIVTLDRTLTFEKLEIAKEAIENGARFFAANIDNTCPVKKGEILDAGSTIAALEKSTHKKLEKNFGKPSKYMIETIKKRINVPLEQCLLTGDRLETDIKMANDFGIDSALVQTGVQKFVNGISANPTYRIENVRMIITKDIPSFS